MEMTQFNNLEDQFLETVGKSLVFTTPHALLLTDKAGKIFYANTNTTKIFGYSVEQLISNSLSVLFTEEDLEYFYPNLLFLARNNKSFAGELMLKKRNESRFYAYLNMTPIEDHPICLYCIQDIDTTKRLSQIVSVGGYDDLIKMANGIAHELRNPLVSIGGFVNRITKVCQLKNQDMRYYENVMSSLRRIEDLVRKVQSFVALPKPEFTACSIREIVEYALSHYSEKIKDKNIKVNLNVSNTITFVDRNLFHNIFCILLENTLEAITHERGEITISDERDDVYVNIFFKDNGVGISSTDLPYVFNPFFSTKPYGIGIDLATVRKIVSAHNGTITVDSKLGEGTTFIITIPIERRRKIRRELFEKENQL